MIKITNKTVKVHTDFYDFMPRWSLEKAEYDNAKITSIDEKPRSRVGADKQMMKRAGDLGIAEPLETWPYLPTTDEIIYHQFLDKITDKSNKFYPARDEDRRPIPKTGACHVVTDIIRVKTDTDTDEDEDNKEFLLSKGHIIAHDAAGVEVTHSIPWPEKWYKTLFNWSSEYNNSSKQFEKRCMGPSGVEQVYLLEFNKDNTKQLFDSRANDNLNFIVKVAQTEEVRNVRDVNVQKTFELFTNNSFDYLFSGEYIPAPVRQELRQEAVARGFIKGGSADYQVTAQPQSKGAPGVR
jgi:hypothetical protein